MRGKHYEITDFWAGESGYSPDDSPQPEVVKLVPEILESHKGILQALRLGPISVGYVENFGDDPDEDHLARFVSSTASSPAFLLNSHQIKRTADRYGVALIDGVESTLLHEYGHAWMEKKYGEDRFEDSDRDDEEEIVEEFAKYYWEWRNAKEAIKILKRGHKRGLRAQEKLPASAKFTGAVDALIREDRWKLDIVEQQGRYTRNRPGEVFEITISPHDAPWLLPVMRPDDATRIKAFIDTRIAYVTPEGEIELDPESGYSTELNLTRDPDLIYRGVSSIEMQDIERTKIIQSKGEYNLGEEQTGYTYFAKDPQSAAHYAGSFSPYHLQPTFDEPAYLLTIPLPDTSKLDPEAPGGEVGVRGGVPAADILSVHEVRPYMIKPGRLEIIRGRGETYSEGSRMSPSVYVAYKQRA